MGEGFINDTLRVETPMGCRDYILQRKNKHIFGDIPAMMEISERLPAISVRSHHITAVIQPVRC